MLEVEFAPARQYAFTLRRTNLKNGAPTKAAYFIQIGKFANKGMCSLKEYVFEMTSGLHMHGILEIPICFYTLEDFEKRFRVRGWNMKLVELYHPEGWRYYMMKEQKLREDADSEFIEEPLTLKHSLFKKHYGETAS